MGGRGYGSRWLLGASECARNFRFGPLTPRGSGRQALGLPALARFLRDLPPIYVPLSSERAGMLIAEHLSLRRWGIPRFRVAQGVLHLPDDFATYLRGRRRQAVRTNNRRARERGITCQHVRIASWRPFDRPGSCSAEAERWLATDSQGDVVAQAWLVVDRDCALLYSLTSNTSYVRWLLHTAIVERLCDEGCPLLITNSYDVPLMPAGQQHFQHLLGYTVGRVRIDRRRRTDIPSSLRFDRRRPTVSYAWQQRIETSPRSSS
jgi:hypothetical protein